MIIIIIINVIIITVVVFDVFDESPKTLEDNLRSARDAHGRRRS